MVCRKRQQVNQPSEAQRSRSRNRHPHQASVPQVVVSSLHGSLHAPKIANQLRLPFGTSLDTVEATPNSGAEITVMSAEKARHLGVQEEALSPPPSIQISAMHCIGTFHQPSRQSIPGHCIRLSRVTWDAFGLVHG